MSLSAASRGFQEPRDVASPAGCYFYHSIDLPGFGLQVGHWDLRADIDAYLGGVSLAGLRVADVGTASGYVSFEMERRGAEVIAFDRDLDDTSDDMGLVPFDDHVGITGRTIEDAIQIRQQVQRQLQDSFWLTHRLFQSRVRLYTGNVYDGLVGEGDVDVSFFGCILLHLRDPLLALTRFGRISRQKLIITETWEDVGTYDKHPVMLLRPNVGDPANVGTWWWMSPVLLERFLRILGFRTFTLTHHTALHALTQRETRLFTLVAER
jgi:hypothetical protein